MVIRSADVLFSDDVISGDSLFRYQVCKDAFSYFVRLIEFPGAGDVRCLCECSYFDFDKALEICKAAIYARSNGISPDAVTDYYVSHLLW